MYKKILFQRLKFTLNKIMDFSRSSCPMEKKSALFNLSSRKWLVGAMSLKSNERNE